MSGPLRIYEMQARCNGCGTAWTQQLEVPLTSAVEIKAFLDAGRMGNCPRSCGAKTADVAFKLSREPGSEARG